ncbi:uncharacterized protein LOC111023349 [Momordica charantia]|uniref:Uncharacterized protein LOC111023349 n=1 Tax=Momordica charantia TaxID=3673 RepID=A0A6J1DS45_MOMCH|nr:uncharacterized protein LOC111023349 [Momordica charantia]
MEVYVDDILVKSKKKTSHIADLTKSFEVLCRYQMKLNPEKCAFGVSSSKFIGFVVNQCGMEVNPERIRAVLVMQPPQNLKQIQCLNRRIIALNRFVSRSTDKCLPFFKKPETSGRLMKWALELNEYDISFEPRAAMKSLPVADFITKLTLLPNSGVENLNRLVLNVDESSNENGSGAESSSRHLMDIIRVCSKVQLPNLEQ